MKSLIGSPGTVSGLVLRVGQFLFASASIGAMLSALGFSTFTAFSYLIASMGLQLAWSLGLACLDVYALRIKRDLQNPVLVCLFVVGDWVTATLSLAAACSSAGVTILYVTDFGLCGQLPISCSRFQISVALAFITWFLVATSSLVMFWMLGSV
ncbi:hypothetical protein IFM89_036457 [Coptis chinensis]|uniref:CASP-like protein n=1 Tax=Coptis chinensis TaxID=261450 RepID=A0A835IYT6_9MAGN|nr:hypothetical protein IFM89_036457 [Coptis chinensis]